MFLPGWALLSPRGIQRRPAPVPIPHQNSVSVNSGDKVNVT